jgi:hypothetical protein
MSEKEFKQVCKCEHCGSEAEMMITCTLEEDLPQQAVDLFAALKEVIAAKSRAARQQKFSSPNRLSFRACNESYLITENYCTLQ